MCQSLCSIVWWVCWQSLTSCLPQDGHLRDQSVSCTGTESVISWAIVSDVHSLQGQLDARVLCCVWSLCYNGPVFYVVLTNWNTTLVMWWSYNFDSTLLPASNLELVIFHFRLVQLLGFITSVKCELNIMRCLHNVIVSVKHWSHMLIRNSCVLTCM